MTEKQLQQFGAVLSPYLEPDEQLLDVAVIQPTAGVTGAGVGIAGRMGTRLARIGAVHGEEGSLASGFPASAPTGQRMLLWVTNRRVLVHTVSATSQAQGQWVAPRSAIAGIQRRPRMQLMAKFRLHFVDGSSTSIMTMRRQTIDALTNQLGKITTS
ncbi:MAG: hypothetical protein DLM55_04585 [Acidimicrobiales bacterium]|nr:MAG: hypothetical protein DLM55_04585 [Acidimicrobiales bacterium]